MSYDKAIFSLIDQLKEFEFAIDSAIMRVNDFVNYRKHAQGRNFITRLKNAGRRKLQ